MKAGLMWSLTVFALVFVGTAVEHGIVHGQIMGPPTEEQALADLQDRVIELEQEAESLNEIIEVLQAQMDDLYVPTEPWHTELRHVHRRMDALASKHIADWTVLYRNMPKTEGGALRGRSKP